MITLILILILGAASCWTLWEQDLFWQVRAGRELMATHVFPTVDTWSYAAAGKPWHNFEWLGTVILALVHDTGGPVGVIIFRALVAMGILGMAARTIRSGPLQLALIPIVYAALSFRIQARPDFLVMAAFAGLMLLWSSHHELRAKFGGTLALTLLSVNLHPGAALFVLLAGAVAALSEMGCRGEALTKKIIYSLLLLSTFVMMPYPTAIWDHLWRHVLYRQTLLVPNPDHDPLSLGMFEVTTQGWFGWAWLALALAGTAALIMAPRLGEGLPPAWRLRRYTLPVAAVFTVLAIDRQRAVPFHALYMLVPATALINHAIKRVHWAAAAAVAMLIVPIQIRSFPFLWGFYVNPFVFPVDTVRFIGQEQLPKNLLHMPPHGDYILGMLPDYPTFFDARETLFDDLQPVYRNLYNSPPLMREVIDHFAIKTVLIANDFLSVKHREDFFPAATWAVVSYDRLATVLVDRAAVAREWLNAHEYRFLVPDIAPWSYPLAKGRTPALDAVFQGELARCRSAAPELIYCIVAEARWLRRDGDPKGTAAARTLLEQAIEKHRGDATLAIEAVRLYRKLGLTADAAAMRELIPPQWRSMADQDDG